MDARSALEKQEIEDIAADLELLAHPVRLQLLSVLAASEGEVCVCDLQEVVPVKQPTVSHHLSVLRKAGVVGVERRGLWAYYHVRRDVLAALRGRVTEGLSRLERVQNGLPVVAGPATDKRDGEGWR
jgi:ArsR family transcriptional regulator